MSAWLGAAALLLGACGGGFDPSGTYAGRLEIAETNPRQLVPCGDGGEASGVFVFRPIEHQAPYTHAASYTLCNWPGRVDLYAAFENGVPWFGEMVAGDFNLSEGTATKDQLTARVRGMGWHHLRLVLERQ